jgi:aldehyde:ferredoxin oxidoreductase
MLRAIELVGRREGVGDLLAEGSRRAAGTIGHTASRSLRK